MSNLARIEALHPDIIDHFIETGESKALTPEIQVFIKQISWAVEIWEFERNITRAARDLKRRIKASQGIVLSERTCKERIYDSMNYFQVDNNVSSKYWLMDAADKYEDLMILAIDQNKLSEAGRFKEKATEYRLRANAEISMSDFAAPVFLISDKMTLEDLDFEKKSLKEIARKDSDGYYVRLITQLPIENDKKAKLLKDANIEDAQIIDDESN